METKLFEKTIEVEAMILDGKEKCLVLGRKSRKKLGRKLRETPEEKGYELSRWSEHLSNETLQRLLEEEANQQKGAEDTGYKTGSKVQKSAEDSGHKTGSKVQKKCSRFRTQNRIESAEKCK